MMPAPALSDTTVSSSYGIGRCRPRGACTLVDAVDVVSRAIEHCRVAGIARLLFDATGLAGLPVPTLVERFLMVEDWARESERRVAVALVIQEEYIHPDKFGVKLAERFGLLCNVFTTQDDALQWLEGRGRPVP